MSELGPQRCCRRSPPTTWTGQGRGLPSRSPASFPCLRTSDAYTSQPHFPGSGPEAPGAAPALYLARATQTLFGVSLSVGAVPVSTASFLGTRSPAIGRKKGVGRKPVGSGWEPSPFPEGSTGFHSCRGLVAGSCPAYHSHCLLLS